MVTPMRDHFHMAIVPMKLMTLIAAVLIVTSVFVTITIVVAAHIGIAVIGRIRPAVIGLNGHACRLRRRNDSGGRSKCKDGSYY
jgi:hypothetical protein